MYRKNNADTNIQTSLAGFSMNILAILSVFIFNLSPKSNINKKELTIMFKHERKNTNLKFDVSSRLIDFNRY